MKKRKGFVLVSMIVLLYIAAIVFGGIGYVKNIIKLCHCDFQQPVKSEVIRGVGIIVAPVGAIVGYMAISDDPEVEDTFKIK